MILLTRSSRKSLLAVGCSKPPHLSLVSPSPLCGGVEAASSDAARLAGLGGLVGDSTRSVFSTCSCRAGDHAAPKTSAFLRISTSPAVRRASTASARLLSSAFFASSSAARVAAFSLKLSRSFWICTEEEELSPSSCNRATKPKQQGATAAAAGGRHLLLARGDPLGLQLRPACGGGGDLV